MKLNIMAFDITSLIIKMTTQQKISRTLGVLLLALSACTYEKIDNNLCKEIPVINALNIVGTACGSATGSIEVITLSSPETTFSIDGTLFQASNLFTNLAAQSYTLTVKNEVGCATTQLVTVENLNGINMLVNSSPSGCNTSNGILSISASGGPEPYTFILNEEITQNNTVFSNLSAGTYTLKAIDANGCSIQQTTEVLTGQSFASIKSIINANCTNSSCHGGSVAPDLRNNQNIQNNASRIKIRTANRSMPPTGSLNNSQIQEIECWVSDGASIK